MVFSSSVFIFLYLPIVLLVYFNPIVKNRTFKNVWLFIMSILFYAWGEPLCVFLMLLSIFVNWKLGRAIHKGRSIKGTITVAVIYNLSLLFVFKYLTFAMSNVGLLINKDFNIINITLPIGISFYTFQALSYVIDVARSKKVCEEVDEADRVPTDNSFLDVGLYIAFFPQLIAGPIVRFETIADEIKNRKENWQDFSEGVYRFMTGLAKKVIIANNVSIVADAVFDGVVSSVATAWIGVICYSIQIFFDFSGYSDMAIGLGKMFGFHFDENFNYPYISRSVTEFWRRWHISLSTWFRDYVYIPLGGNRVSAVRHIFNLGVIWFLTGLWHGANWTFILWGVIYFVVQVIEKYVKFPKKLSFLGHIYTLLVVMACWVLFRAQSITDAGVYLSNMFGLSDVSLIDDNAIFHIKNVWVYVVAGAVFSTPVAKIIDEKLKDSKLYSVVAAFVMVVLFIITIAQVISSSYDPFIYFNF